MLSGNGLHLDCNRANGSGMKSGTCDCCGMNGGGVFNGSVVGNICLDRLKGGILA